MLRDPRQHDLSLDGIRVKNVCGTFTSAAVESTASARP